MSANQRVPAEYLPIFCRELYQMVHAGITPAEGLSLLKEDETDPKILEWLTKLCEQTDEGARLGDALRETGTFPVYMTDMIDLAEQTGHLEDTLLGLQKHYNRQNRLRDDIQRAITVPLILLIVMIAVVLLLITQVLPVFDRVFAQLGVRMGAVATGMMKAGAVLARVSTVFAGIVVVIALIGLLIGITPSLREKFSAWILRNFGGRGIMGQAAVARFTSAMAMSTAGGLSMEESVELSSRLCGGAKEIDEKTEKCRKLLEEGNSAADSLSGSGLYSGRDSLLLKLAERTGSVSDTLEDLAVRQEEESVRQIDRLVGTIEPAIVVLTSALSALILLSVMLPLLGLLSSIG